MRRRCRTAEKASKLASRHEHAARASTGTVVHMADTPRRDPASDLVIIERWIIFPASFRIDESRRHLCPGTADDVIREGTLCFTSGRDSVSPAARIQPGRMEERPTVNPHGHDQAKARQRSQGSTECRLCGTSRLHPSYLAGNHQVWRAYGQARGRAFFCCPRQPDPDG